MTRSESESCILNEFCTFQSFLVASQLTIVCLRAPNRMTDGERPLIHGGLRFLNDSLPVELNRRAEKDAFLPILQLPLQEKDFAFVCVFLNFDSILLTPLLLLTKTVVFKGGESHLKYFGQLVFDV